MWGGPSADKCCYSQNSFQLVQWDFFSFFEKSIGLELRSEFGVKKTWLVFSEILPTCQREHFQPFFEKKMEHWKFHADLEKNWTGPSKLLFTCRGELISGRCRIFGKIWIKNFSVSGKVFSSMWSILHFIRSGKKWMQNLKAYDIGSAKNW